MDTATSVATFTAARPAARVPVAQLSLWAPPVPQPLDVAAIDWDELHRAVLQRLRRCAESRWPPVALNDDLLECVTALEQLHTTLAHEIAVRRQQELEMFDLRMALMLARRDLAGTRAGERRARHQSLHDGLTSLPNGSLLREELARAVDGGQPVALMYLDLDGFKAINDRHGHSVGDELLRIIATRLRRAVRGEDVVSRLGGDEFACLLYDAPEREQLSHMACKLFDAVSAPCTLGNLNLQVRPSIGIALAPQAGLTPEALLHQADAAMYDAKRRQSGYAFGAPPALPPA